MYSTVWMDQFEIKETCIKFVINNVTEQKSKKERLESEQNVHLLIVLFMAKLEEKIYQKSEFKSCLWLRDIDDIFFVWKHGEGKLKSFIDNVNKMQPTIKFTADWSKTLTDFLNVAVSITKGIIETDLYVKPTDSYQYLLSSSCHSFNCKKDIPYS